MTTTIDNSQTSWHVPHLCFYDWSPSLVPPHCSDARQDAKWWHPVQMGAIHYNYT